MLWGGSNHGIVAHASAQNTRGVDGLLNQCNRGLCGHGNLDFEGDDLSGLNRSGARTFLDQFLLEPGCPMGLEAFLLVVRLTGLVCLAGRGSVSEEQRRSVWRAWLKLTLVRTDAG